MPCRHESLLEHQIDAHWDTAPSLLPQLHTHALSSEQEPRQSRWLRFSREDPDADADTGDAERTSSSSSAAAASAASAASAENCAHALATVGAKRRFSECADQLTQLRTGIEAPAARGEHSDTNHPPPSTADVRASIGTRNYHHLIEQTSAASIATGTAGASAASVSVSLPIGNWKAYDDTALLDC